MEAVATRVRSRSRWAPPALDRQAISAWALAFALVLYLAVDGGGYALVTHAQVGIAVWWLVVLCSAWGLLPIARLTGRAIVTIGLFAAFTAWTALGITWSISSARSFQDLALVTTYLGILVLAVSIHRERGQAVRQTIAGVATAIVVVALLALSSRFWPNLFPASQQTGQFLHGVQARLSWPLNYWNALAALMAIGVPLLLAQASAASTLTMQALATAAIPLVALCGVFTLSRGGAIEVAVGLAVFIALAPERVPKLATAALAAAGSAVLIYGGLHRHAIQQGLGGAGASHEVSGLVVAIVLVCAGVGVAAAGVGLLTRHATLPRLLTPTRARARALTAVGIVLVVALALAAGAPHRLHHAWEDFKSPHNAISASSAGRLGSASGEGRYQYWVAAVDSAQSHPLTGSGPGTFQLDWLPRAPFSSYVVNAHSLYVETYAELGLVGLVLLVGFLGVSVVAVVRLVARSREGERTRAAAIAAALAAFLVSAGFDWVWQMPVVPAAILLLVAAVMAPRAAPAVGSASSGPLSAPAAQIRRPGFVTQVVMVLAGLACLVAIAYPLAANNAIAASQSAASAGQPGTALAEAQSAVRLEPGSGPANLQLALVYEMVHAYRPALVAARHAVASEPQNWANWLVLSRLEAENGHAHASLAAYLRAKSLNPHSTLFRRS